MEFEVSIDKFEGPLDLMLHLIKQKELDLFDLDILVLVDQYVEYINIAKDIHLEVASEYLTMLATLIEYKSKKLLPKEEAILDDDYQEDPHDLLIKRLIEYQQFKEISEDLELRYKNRKKQYSVESEIIVEDWIKDIKVYELEEDVSDLIKAMDKVMQRFTLDNPFMTKVTHKEISVDDRIVSIRNRFKHKTKSFSFEEVVSDSKDINVFVVTFLAVLDMIRLNVITYFISNDDKLYFKWSDIDG